MPSSVKPRARPSLWGIRTSLPTATGRLISLVAIALFVAVWCALSYITVQRGDHTESLVSRSFLPAPDEVFRALLYLILDEQKNLLGAIGISASRIAKAFALSVAVALPLGILMGSFEAVNRFFDPLVAPMRYLPISAFIPLMICWFGIYEAEKIAFLFLGTVVYLLPAVVDAVRAVPEELTQTAFTLGATKRQVITTVLIPAAMPQIFDGFRVLNAIAWTYIILAEMVNPQDGVGSIFEAAGRSFKPDWSFAGILAVGVIGILTDAVIRWLNSVIFGWREADV